MRFRCPADPEALPETLSSDSVGLVIRAEPTCPGLRPSKLPRHVCNCQQFGKRDCVLIFFASVRKETVVLLSMTGFGDARSQNQEISIAVEVRTVNNRYFKVSMKYPDSYNALESRIEKTVRESITRGTVSVAIRTDRKSGERPYRLNSELLSDYWQQLNTLADNVNAPSPHDLAQLLTLPSVVSETTPAVVDLESDWELIGEALRHALEKLQAFRSDEGQAMHNDLHLNCRLIETQLEQIAKLAPQVVRDYRDRLQDRVRDLLAEVDVAVDASHLIREVSIFADRCDINEEITRLRCHLEQFENFLNADVSSGRKLEFLSQEMFREVNTIGSKANNVLIAHCVVEMKSAVEKIREILQNVE